MNNVIYKATNMVNGKVYIGLTTQGLKVRKRRHRGDALSGKSNLVFHIAIRKYGWDNFKWEIIDTAERADELNDKEVYWISYYDSYRNGYNSTLGGEGISGFKIPRTEAHNINNAIAQGAKPFLVYDLNGRFIGEYISKGKCARELGLIHRTLGRTLSSNRKSKGYILIYKDEFSEELLSELIGDRRNRASDKLTEEQVVEIKMRLMNKEKPKKLAMEYGISYECMLRIRRGEAWADINVDGWKPYKRKPSYKPKSKFSDNDILMIFSMIEAGVKLKDIALKYNVHVNTISKIKNSSKYDYLRTEIA